MNACSLFAGTAAVRSSNQERCDGALRASGSLRRQCLHAPARKTPFERSCVHLARVWTLAGLCLVMPGGATAQTADATASQQGTREPVVTWGAEVEVASQYVWRGFRYSEGMVVWPSAWISARGWTGSLMFNVDRESDPTWNEYDLEVTYERSAGRLTLTGGYARYTYYDADSTGVTSEVVGRTDFSLGPGRMFTTHAIDVQKYRGSYYLEAGYDVGLEVGTRSAIAAEVSLAFWSLFIERYTRDTAPDLAAGPVGPLLVTVSYSASIAPALAVRTSVSSVRIFNDAARRFLDPPRLTASLAIVVGR